MGKDHSCIANNNKNTDGFHGASGKFDLVS